MCGVSVHVCGEGQRGSAGSLRVFSTDHPSPLPQPSTYAPRALVIDDPDSLGAGLTGCDDDGATSAPPGDTWTGAVAAPPRGPPLPRSRFAAALADPTTRDADLAAAAADLATGAPPASWTDFLKAPLPRAALLPAPGWRPRSGYGPPPDAALSTALEDGMRRHAERCDRLGGVVVLVDDTGGWGGVAAAALAAARDDWPRTPPPRLLRARRECRR